MPSSFVPVREARLEIKPSRTILPQRCDQALTFMLFPPLTTPSTTLRETLHLLSLSRGAYHSLYPPALHYGDLSAPLPTISHVPPATAA